MPWSRNRDNIKVWSHRGNTFLGYPNVVDLARVSSPQFVRRKQFCILVPSDEISLAFLCTLTAIRLSFRPRQPYQCADNRLKAQSCVGEKQTNKQNLSIMASTLLPPAVAAEQLRILNESAPQEATHSQTIQLFFLVSIFGLWSLAYFGMTALSVRRSLQGKQKLWLFRRLDRHSGKQKSVQIILSC